MASILRILADVGDAVGWLVAAVVVFYYARHVVRENERAHAALAESIKKNADGIRVNGEAIATLRGEAIATLRGEAIAIATGRGRAA